MTKKPRQKLNNLLNLPYFKTFLVLLFVLAQIAGFFVSPILNQATAATCTITSNSQMVWDLDVSRTRVGWDEIFEVQAVASFITGQEDVSTACALAKDDYDLRIYLYNTATGVSTGDYEPGVLISGGTYFSGVTTGTNSIGSGFAGRKSMTIKQLAGTDIATLPEPGSQPINVRTGAPSGTKVPDPNTHYLRAFIWNNKTNNYENVYSNSKPIAYSKNSTGEAPTTLPALPTGVQPDTTTTPADSADTIPFDALFFKVSIDSAKEDKFRNFYRITYDQGGFVAVAQKPEGGRTNREHQLVTFSAFDQAGGIPVKMGLGQKSTISSLRVGSNGHYISYSKIGTQYSSLSYLTGNTHRINSIKAIGIEQNLTKDKTICGVSVFSATQYFCDSSKSKNNGATTGDVLLGKDQSLSFPFLLNSAPAMSQMGLNADGKTLNTVLVLPTINLTSDWKQWIAGGIATGLTAGGAAPVFFSSLAAPPGFTYAAEPTQKVYFEVYPTKAALDAAKDNPIPDTVAEYSEVETGNTESSGKGLGETLLDFIRKVITHLLSLLTSLVYYVFSFIVAPFLVAILKIQAYKDDFVSVIYPGWLILRNISNIFFIIALLAIGLGTMFNRQGYQARGLIVNLILMALLINFSLVFAQAIVALADTLQAQFLPGDSRVIHALAAKLMVEPLQLLRDSTGGAGFGASTALADISKAFVLLLFSVAALFAFVAVGAFLMVRLIALWVLYLLSPLAFAAFILPDTNKYFGQWWGELIKYAFIGASLAFFLNMAALLAGGDFFQRANFGAEDGFAAGAINFVLMSAQNLAVIGFMIMGMKFAAKSGAVGAQYITDKAAQATKGTFKLANKGKQALSNKAFGGMSQKEGWKGLVGKAGLAVSNPIMAGKAGHAKGKALLDKDRKKFEDNIAGIYGSNKPVLGNSIKEEREKMKEFVSDDENYLKAQLAGGLSKKDKVLTGAGMMKLADTGKFKDIMETVNGAMGTKFANNAEGLNAATAEMVKRGLLDDGKRRDILNEFDRAAGKDKKNAHFGGNIKYDEEKKDFVIRDVDYQIGADGAVTGGFGTADEDEWTKGQVKGRKNNLYEDLKSAANEATVEKGANNQTQFTDTMAAVLAEQTVEALNNKKAATNFRVNNNDKFKVMKEAFDAPGGEASLKTQMVNHYKKDLAKEAEVYAKEKGINVGDVKDDDLDTYIKDKAQQRIDAMKSNLLKERTDGGGDDDDEVTNKKSKKTKKQTEETAESTTSSQQDTTVPASVIVAPNGRPAREVVAEQNARTAQQQGRNVDLANPNAAIDNAVNQAPNTQAPPVVTPPVQTPQGNTQIIDRRRFRDEQPPMVGPTPYTDPQELAERAREAEMNRQQAERDSQANRTPPDNTTPPPTNNA